VQVRITAGEGDRRKPADRVLIYSMLDSHKPAENTA
jgi:hypothetical protein